MDIVEVREFGGPGVLVAGTAPDPVAGAGQVVIGVVAADVMSLDAQLRAGWGQEYFPLRPPYTPGTGVAGRVLEVGDGVPAEWLGRRVAALLPGGGGYATRAVADVATLVAVPDGLDLRAAAAIIQVGPAALALTDAAGLRPGARVLVTGAGGALGLPIVRLAAAAGARVTAAATGAAKREAALRYGATEVIGYPDLVARTGEGADPTAPGGGAELTARTGSGGGFDVVFDGVGGRVGAAALRATVDGGMFFAYGVPSGSTAEIGPGEAGRVRIVGMELVRFEPAEFRRLAGRALGEAAAGGLATHLGMVVPLREAARAHAALEARELAGKAVLVAAAQAVRYDRHGGPEVLRLDEVPLPEPGPGQVRVAVRAAGVNPVDWKLRRGLMGPVPDAPAGTGLELAGVVDAAGPGVERWRPGDAVFGPAAGAAATYALADAGELAAIPGGMTFEEAAALPVAAETAYRALRRLGVTAGKTLLIHAVAGGVGLVAARLALARGARVIGTASERHHAYLRGMGVHPVVYGPGLEERITERVDLVLDASGRDVLGLSVKLTGDPGRVVTIADPRGAAAYGVHFSTGMTERVPFPEVVRAAGDVRLPVAAAFPLERAADAHRLSEDGHFLGKILLIAEAGFPR
ncbi:MAG TPA: zinc-binding dehydrogenase [Nonomuraea sp.]|nr:zinc-binding dehydrogenase [Nonomuraea sp.]